VILLPILDITFIQELNQVILSPSCQVRAFKFNCIYGIQFNCSGPEGKVKVYKYNPIIIQLYIKAEKEQCCTQKPANEQKQDNKYKKK
jgi:hypothetical protein